jgi:hypothetical protein
MDKTSKEYIANLLVENDRAVERAIVVLYNRQTSDEQVSQVTKESNGVGFRSNHARTGTYYAKWILSGKRLTGKHLVNARQITLHYLRQLSEAAAQKQKEIQSQTIADENAERIAIQENS